MISYKGAHGRYPRSYYTFVVHKTMMRLGPRLEDLCSKTQPMPLQNGGQQFWVCSRTVFASVSDLSHVSDIVITSKSSVGLQYDEVRRGAVIATSAMCSQWNHYKTC